MNKVILRGFVVRDAEGFVYKEDKLGVNFSIAVKSGYGSSEVVDYFDCSRFNFVSDKLIESIKTGTHVLISGPIHIKNVEKDGVWKRYVTVIVEDFEFLPNIAPKKEEEKSQPKYKNYSK